MLKLSKWRRRSLIALLVPKGIGPGVYTVTDPPKGTGPGVYSDVSVWDRNRSKTGPAFLEVQFLNLIGNGLTVRLAGPV